LRRKKQQTHNQNGHNDLSGSAPNLAYIHWRRQINIFHYEKNNKRDTNSDSHPNPSMPTQHFSVFLQREFSHSLYLSSLALFGFLITHSLVFLSLSLELSTLVSPECLGTGLCTIVLWHWPWHPGALHCPSSFSLLLPPLVFPLSLHSLEEALFFLQVVLFYLCWDGLQGMEAWLFIASRCPTSSFK
jgi:hypothetical protein